MSEAKANFDAIYSSHAWGSPPSDGGPAIYSGPGADASRCSQYLAYVQDLIDRPDVSTVTEIGCGDLRLTGQLDLSDVSYECFDVASQVRSHAPLGIRVREVDAASHDFDGADLLLVKDVFQHWPTEKVRHFEETQLPKFKHAVVTNDYGGDEDKPRDVAFGGYAGISLRGNRNVVLTNVCADHTKQTQHFFPQVSSTGI